MRPFNVCLFLASLCLAQPANKTAAKAPVVEGAVAPGFEITKPTRVYGLKWSYNEPGTGPFQWVNLDNKYSACFGQQQSPINIDESALQYNTKGSMVPLLLNYLATETKEAAAFNQAGDIPVDVILNDGNQILMYYERGSFLQTTLTGERYTLDRLSFHSPSEHKILGKQYDLEMQLIHTSATGHNVVVALMFQVGKNNEFLDAAHWNELPHGIGSTKLNSRINVLDAFGWDMNYYHYTGSLTTPPCTEGTLWYIMQEVQELSKRQLERFKSAVGFENNRPLQPLRSRLIFSSTGKQSMASRKDPDSKQQAASTNPLPPACSCLDKPRTCPCSPWYKQWVSKQEDVVQVTDLTVAANGILTPAGFMPGELPTGKKLFLKDVGSELVSEAPATSGGAPLDVPDSEAAM